MCSWQQIDETTMIASFWTSILLLWRTLFFAKNIPRRFGEYKRIELGLDHFMISHLLLHFLYKLIESIVFPDLFKMDNFLSTSSKNSMSNELLLDDAAYGINKVLLIRLRGRPNISHVFIEWPGTLFLVLLLIWGWWCWGRRCSWRWRRTDTLTLRSYSWGWYADCNRHYNQK